MSPAPATEVISLGCRLNIAESETIRQLLGTASDPRGTIVVNSCAVTAAAARQSRAAVRRARAAHPDARIVVTGCAATIDPDAFAAMPEVDRVVANSDKLAPGSWGARANRAPVAAFTGHARAFVGVQTGCDHACTFCIIPAGRGASRSDAAGAVIERVAALVDAGHREVVLTGVDLASYGADLPGAPPLGLLVERILTHVPALARLRLSSLDPVAIDARLFELLASECRVMPHLHLSLQAGDDLILKRMRRRHGRADAIALVARLKARRDVAIGADLIAGFPTETAAAARGTLALLDDCGIVHAHVFPYSPRAGTPAARMPQVPPAIVRKRAAALRDAAAARRAAWLTGQIGTIQAVLVERPGDRGHAGNFADVVIDGPLTVGEIATLRIVGATADHLVGTAA